MKIIKRESRPCDCLTKLAALQSAEAGRGKPLDVGSEVRCDCGETYRLKDAQFDGPYWQRLVTGAF